MKKKKKGSYYLVTFYRSEDGTISYESIMLKCKGKYPSVSELKDSAKGRVPICISRIVK